jgi:hypothetical protein
MPLVVILGYMGLPQAVTVVPVTVCLWVVGSMLPKAGITVRCL